VGPGRLKRFPVVLVTFRKLVEERVTTWDAVRGERTRIPGTTMALGRGGLPHDLAQMIVEASVGIDRGFWGTHGCYSVPGLRTGRP